MNAAGSGSPKAINNKLQKINQLYGSTTSGTFKVKAGKANSGNLNEDLEEEVKLPELSHKRSLIDSNSVVSRSSSCKD